MQVNIEALQNAIKNDKLVQSTWHNDATRAACLMGWLVDGARSVDDCVTAGWPEWLVNLNISLFDSCPADEKDRFALGLALACRGKIIPETVAMEHTARCLDRCVGYIGPGDEDWRVECRTVVANTVTTLRSGRWLTVEEAAGAARAAGAAERQSQRSDLIDLLRAIPTEVA